MGVSRGVVDFVRADGHRRLSCVAGQRCGTLGSLAVLPRPTHRKRVVAGVFLPLGMAAVRLFLALIAHRPRLADDGGISLSFKTRLPPFVAVYVVAFLCGISQSGHLFFESVTKIKNLENFGNIS